MIWIGLGILAAVVIALAWVALRGSIGSALMRSRQKKSRFGKWL